MKLECEFFTGSARIMYQESTMDVIKDIANMPGQEDAFFVLDVGDIIQKIKVWQLKMPRVKPFYAVKCNDNQTVLELLAALGTGFDCASKAEIQKVLNLGVDQSRIIYAHPCKPASHLRHAAKVKVPLMTFDNETELYKVQAYYPDAELVLRIRCDAEDAQCPLGIKFGVFPEDAAALLATAKSLDLNVVGVSFHVGSGCREPAVFYRAISAAKQVFEEAEALGFNPNILDIGGGFPGGHDSSLDELARYINEALDEFFPEDTGVKVIAEPGRYVVASAFTLATSVVAKREVCDDNDAVVSTMYYTNDGVYGSFNCTLYDHQTVHPEVLKDVPAGEDHMTCSVWGPTCDGLDQVVSEVQLPSLDCGDWLVWRDMGAYTLSAAGTFNGFPIPKVHVAIPHHTWLYLEEYLGANLSFCPVDGAAVHSNYLDSSSLPFFTPAFCHRDATSHDPVSFEDQLAQLDIIDVGEM
ncbi:ornithine decarboxylase 1-like [Macrobrachium nipponense]|uniref:ornithine decarboxylase 1-like n=1 Tax=Macrobrachium nipponense TaxID=159736 RepID=UPI0030C802BC